MNRLCDRLELADVPLVVQDPVHHVDPAVWVAHAVPADKYRDVTFLSLEAFQIFKIFN